MLVATRQLREGIAGGRVDVEVARRVLASHRPDEQAGAIEKAARGIEIGRSHRHVEGVDVRGERQRGPAQGVDLPASLAILRIATVLARTVRAHCDEVPSKFADQVAARHPRAANGILSRRIGIIHRAGHLEQMRVEVMRDNAVTSGIHRRSVRLAPSTRIERVTPFLGGRCSIH